MLFYQFLLNEKRYFMAFLFPCFISTCLNFEKNLNFFYHKCNFFLCRKCMLPSFISLKQAQKVLATGKSLNFLRHVCNFKSAIGDRDLIQTAVGKTSGTF